MADSQLPPQRADDSRHDPPVGGSLHTHVRYDKVHVSAWHVVGVLIVIGLVFVAAGLVSGWFVNRQNTGADGVESASSYRVSTDQLPEAPRLEPLDSKEATTTSNVFANQLAMERQLHSYGDTEEEGYVHIPIEQAMTQVIGELPASPGETKPPARSFGLAEGGESNSGRVYSEAPSWLREHK